MTPSCSSSSSGSPRWDPVVAPSTAAVVLAYQRPEPLEVGAVDAVDEAHDDGDRRGADPAPRRQSVGAVSAPSGRRRELRLLLCRSAKPATSRLWRIMPMT